MQKSENITLQKSGKIENITLPNILTKLLWKSGFFEKQHKKSEIELFWNQFYSFNWPL